MTFAAELEVPDQAVGSRLYETMALSLNGVGYIVSCEACRKMEDPQTAVNSDGRPGLRNSSHDSIQFSKIYSCGRIQELDQKTSIVHTRQTRHISLTPNLSSTTRPPLLTQYYISRSWHLTTASEPLQPTYTFRPPANDSILHSSDPHHDHRPTHHTYLPPPLSPHPHTENGLAGILVLRLREPQVVRRRANSPGPLVAPALLRRPRSVLCVSRQERYPGRHQG
jgi:hypothetical protein